MIWDLLEKRRSIRRFADRPVAAEKIDQLLEAALRAPSSRSLNPWEFVTVDDRDRLQALAGCKPHGAAFLADAPLGIVVCADPSRCDVWIEDCAIALSFMQLAAVELGLGSCWIQVRQRDHAGGAPASDYIAGLLDLPARLQVAAMLAVGYPEAPKAGHPREALLFERVHRNRFGTPYRFGG